MQRKFIDDFYRESEKCLTPYSQILKAFTPNINIEDRFVECNPPPHGVRLYKIWMKMSLEEKKPLP